MDSAKIQTIMDWLEPRKVKDIQSLFGFANFYCCFISDYSKIVVLLTCLACKGNQWNFTDEVWKSFNAFKATFTSVPVLVNWEPNKPLIVEMDASNYALGAILSIISDSSDIHPITFHSCTFTSPKQNFNTHDKELLTIFDAFWVWKHYLEGSGTPIDMVTDHKNREYFFTTKILTHQQVQWSEFLSGFNLIICFCPGQLGTKLDSLTRQWDIYPKFISHSSDPKPHWSITPDGCLHHNSLIYVPHSSNLCLCILWYRHDHILSGHPGDKNKINAVMEMLGWIKYHNQLQSTNNILYVCLS